MSRHNAKLDRFRLSLWSASPAGGDRFSDSRGGSSQWEPQKYWQHYVMLMSTITTDHDAMATILL
jgi:subtilase family serine protease